MLMNEPLVLLPGMMCDARIFTPQTATFSVDRPVMVAPLTGRTSFAELAKDVLAHAPSRFALAGLSKDGITAMQIVRQAMAEALGAEAFVNQSLALQRRLDRSDTSRTVQVPTLILCGTDDNLCPLVKHERILGLIPGARLAVVPGAGHLPTLEQPEQSNRELNQWLNT